MKNTILKFQAILVVGCLMANACGAKSAGNLATTATTPIAVDQFLSESLCGSL